MNEPRIDARTRPGGRMTLLVLLSLVAAVVISACGGDDSSGGGTSASSGQSGEAAPDVAYDGPEADLPTKYPEPKAGGDYTIGWLNPFAANESLRAQENGLKLRISELGGKVISLDDQLDVDRQVSNFRQLLAQDVDAIGFFPIDPEATDPLLKQAKAQGVPVVAIEKTQTPDQPAGEIATQVWQGRDIQAYRQAKQMAELKPGGKIGIIGIAAPVPALKYWEGQAEQWASAFGLDVVATAEDPSGDAAGGERAMNEIIADAPDLDGVIAYNDSVGLAAAGVARSNGLQDLPIVALNGQSDGLDGVRDGRLAADFQLDSVGIGMQAADALWTLAGDPNADLPPIVVRPPSEAIVEANVSEAKTWDQQLEELGAGG